MSEAPAAIDYLDAIFAAIRAFAAELGAARRWLDDAERAEHQAWRLSFLREARGRLASARTGLGCVDEQLCALGSADDLPAPLDKVAENLLTMRKDLEAQRSRLEVLEASAASSAAPIGRA